MGTSPLASVYVSTSMYGIAGAGYCCVPFTCLHWGMNLIDELKSGVGCKLTDVHCQVFQTKSPSCNTQLADLLCESKSALKLHGS